MIGVVSAADLLAKEAIAGESQNFTGPLAGCCTGKSGRRPAGSPQLS